MELKRFSNMNSWMINVENINSQRNVLPVTQSEGSGEKSSTLPINRSLSIHLSSKDYMNSKYAFDPKKVLDQENKAWESGDSYQAFLNWTIIGSAYDYTDKFNAIHNDMKTESERVEAINLLNRSYTSSVGKAIDLITKRVDRFFDRGRAFLSIHSRSDVNDMFDSVKFKSRLTDNVLIIKESILNSEVKPSEISVIKEFLNADSNVSELEQMSLEDLTGVLKYAIDGYELANEVSPLNKGMLEYHANRDHFIDKWIKESDFSHVVQNGLKKVLQRKSEGLIRSITYGEERKNYKTMLDLYDEELEKLYEKLALIEEKLKELEENGRVHTKNKMLFYLLEVQGDLNEQIELMEEERETVEEQDDELKGNPALITDTDSYKTIKSEYEELRKALQV